MTNTTCTELYNDMIENTYDLLCDISVIEALYRCRAQLPRFDTLPALSAEIWRTRCFLDQHAHDTGTCGRLLLDRLATEAGIEKEPS